jgi:hypothetical protein
VLTCGQIPLLVVIVICADLAGLTVIFHCSIQFCSRLRCCCSLCEAVAGSWSDDMIAVSSANVAISVLSVSGTSAVNIRYRGGPRTLLCGTPAPIN